MTGVSTNLWATGAAYERYVGRWSRLVAETFLNRIAVQPGKAWLDIGSGTGALSELILASQQPLRIVGVDSSEGFVKHARAHVSDTRVEFRVGDAQALPVESQAFDAAVSGLMLNFVPNKEMAIAEMRRAVRPGGTAALYVWDYADGMQLMLRFWQAAAALDPKARDHAERLRFPICKPKPLRALSAAAGLSEIAVDAIDVPTTFADFDDYWSPFLGGTGPAPAYCMSLSDEGRAALRERLKDSLLVDADGKIRLTARAWAIRGTV